jgi:hypothetical protein
MDALAGLEAGRAKEIRQMCNRRMFHAASFVAALLSTAACTDPAAGVSETLGSAIRDVGFPCESVVSSQASNESGDSWRIACSDARVYAASIEESGDLCIEPVLFVDAVGPQPVQFPEARCTSDVSLQ